MRWFNTARMDLCPRYGEVTLGIELKTWRAGEGDPAPGRLTQLDEYLAGLGLPSGWLVAFDQRPNQPPIAERTTVEQATTPGGRAVTLVRGSGWPGPLVRRGRETYPISSFSQPGRRVAPLSWPLPRVVTGRWRSLWPAAHGRAWMASAGAPAWPTWRRLASVLT